jgi:hypothetical protein
MENQRPGQPLQGDGLGQALEISLKHIHKLLTNRESVAELETSVAGG